MIVTCESCGTKFRVDERKLKKPVTKVRCSRCKHVFVIRLEPESDDEEMVILDPTTNEDLPKDFEKEIGGKVESTTSPTTVEPPTSASTTRRPYSQPPVARSKIFVLVALPLLIIAVGVSYYFFANPVKRAVKQSPRVEVPPITVSDKTEAYFIENVHVGQMLVVQGEVINTAPYPVSFIMLEGKIYGPKDKVAIRQRFYAGNIMTKEELAQWPINEIQSRILHREGDNLSNVHVKPGERVPYMVVFYNLPPIEELTDYSVEYINAEAEKPSITM